MEFCKHILGILVLNIMHIFTMLNWTIAIIIGMPVIIAIGISKIIIRYAHSEPSDMATAKNLAKF